MQHPLRTKAHQQCVGMVVDPEGVECVGDDSGDEGEVEQAIEILGGGVIDDQGCCGDGVDCYIYGVHLRP